MHQLQKVRRQNIIHNPSIMANDGMIVISSRDESTGSSILQRIVIAAYCGGGSVIRPSRQVDAFNFHCDGDNWYNINNE